jgi:protein O-GlcNAc transferase
MNMRSRLQLAESYLQNGNPQKARSICEQLLSEFPEQMEALDFLCQALLQLGQHEAALPLLERMNQFMPESSQVQFNLGITLQKLERWTESSMYLQQARRLKPDWAEAHFYQALALENLGKPLEALIGYRAACMWKSDWPEAHYQLGCLLREQKRSMEAAASLYEALNLRPNWMEALVPLSEILIEGKSLLDSITILEKTQPYYGTRPESASLMSSIQSLAREVTSYYLSVGKISPEIYSATALLLSLNYREDIEPLELYHAHQHWGLHTARQAEHERFAHTPQPQDAERPLKIGYISQDFRNQSVNFFLKPILESHCRERFQVFLYSSLPSHLDSTTEEFQRLADVWRDIRSMDDIEAARCIHADAIDILVDLTGHSGLNRLRILAYKPAPVQCTYLGYPNTTGLPTIDYRITDSLSDPIGQTEQWHTEHLLRMPSCFLCYGPSSEAPPVGSLPAITNGYVTFASFNTLAKISPDVLSLWAEILHRLPTARLIIKSQVSPDPATQDALLNTFAKKGIDPYRLEVLQRVASYQEHLDCYNRTDIALDPFPYNGTTTTCEALWMGVPVIALSGRTHVARVGVSLLNAVGLSEFIAPSVDAYRVLAVDLAGDLERLEGLRASLRERLAASSLLDASSFTSKLETLYRQVWQQWEQVGKNQ